MKKRNSVVRDLIQRPPRGAGKHRDRRRELRENDSGKKLKIFLQKPPHGGFFMYYLSTVTTDRNSEGNEMRLSDVIKQRQAQQVSDEKREAAARAKFTPQQNLHPAIGSLMTAKGVKYYAYVDGAYREGSPEQLTSLLVD